MPRYAVGAPQFHLSIGSDSCSRFLSPAQSPEQVRKLGVSHNIGSEDGWGSLARAGGTESGKERVSLGKYFSW